MLQICVLTATLTVQPGQQMDNVTYGIQFSIALGPANAVVRIDFKLYPEKHSTNFETLLELK